MCVSWTVFQVTLVVIRSSSTVTCLETLRVTSCFSVTILLTVMFVNMIGAAVTTGMEAEGLTVQQFNESAGGQVVFHLHVHLLPRWEGIALKPPGTMGDHAEIAAHAAKIRAART